MIKIGVDEEGELVLREVYSGVGMETSEGNKIGICMRDDTFEINVIPKKGKSQWFRVDMQDTTVVPMKPGKEVVPMTGSMIEDDEETTG